MSTPRWLTSPNDERELLELMRTEPRPAHWTSHRDGTHTQSTDTVNRLMDLACARVDEEEDAA